MSRFINNITSSEIIITNGLNNIFLTNVNGELFIDEPSGSFAINSTGPQGPTGFQGEIGPQGPTGDQGETGPIGGSYPTIETITGTGGISPNINISFVSGTSHTLGTGVNGFPKSIINLNSTSSSQTITGNFIENGSQSSSISLVNQGQKIELVYSNTFNRWVI